MDENRLFGFISTYGYNAGGFRVTVSLNIYRDVSNEEVFNELDAMIYGGNLTVNPPGIEPGEQSEVVTHIVRRRSKDNTPFVGFYLDHPKMIYKWFSLYLNIDDAGKALAAEIRDKSGLSAIGDIPLYIQKQFPSKDELAGKDSRYLVRLPYPLRITKRDNGIKHGAMGDYTDWQLVRIERAANAIQKLAADGEIEQGMTQGEALDVLAQHYDHVDGSDDEAMVVDEGINNDIPF